MIAAFDWWLLIVGIVGGAGLVWLVTGDLRRNEEDLADDERAIEAAWISDSIGSGRRLDEATVDEVLRLHRVYLASTPPDLDPVEQVAEAERREQDAAQARGTPSPTAAAPTSAPPASAPPADPGEAGTRA